MTSVELLQLIRFSTVAVLATGSALAVAPSVTDATPPANSIRVPQDAELSIHVADADSQELSVTFFGRRVGSADPADEFSVIALPDTQFYSENRNGDRAAIFSAQTEWIVAEQEARNIGFVLHLGDITQNGDRVDTAETQWRNASDAMYRLENPVTTERAEGVPYVMAVGNHDQTPIGDADGTTIGFNTWFGVHPETQINHFEGKSYYGGTSEPTNADNNFCLFTAGGMDFIVISLEYDTTPDAADLQWADDLLKAYPARRGIVITHHLVNTGNPAAFSTLGQAIYNRLRSNPNLILMHGGHVAGEGRRTDTYQGRQIHSILADYQGRANGGDGWLRILKFRPLLNRIDIETYSPTLDQYETDEDSQFSLDVNLQGGIGPFSEITKSSALPGTVTATWPDLEAGTRYEWYASVSDGTTTVATPVQSFITGGVQFPPVVAITSPNNGEVIRSQGNVVLEATATDLDGTVEKVEFFQGTQRIGSVDQPPYRFEWKGLETGSYAVIAKATDNDGVVGASLPISVQVVIEPPAPDTSTSSAALINRNWSVVATTAAPGNFNDPGSNVGDISLSINSSRVVFRDGIVAVSNWENPENGTATSDDNIVSPYFNADGYAWVNNYDNSNPNAADANPSCTEESAGTGVGFFSYAAGWVGASVRADGTVISSNLPEGVTIRHADAGSYQISGLSTTGNLFAFPNGNGGLSGDNVVSTRSEGGIWTIEIRDNSSSRQDGDHSFLYVPESTEGVLSGRVLANGSVVPMNVTSRAIGVSATRDSDSINLLVGNGTLVHPNNSVLFLTGDCSSSLNGADNIHSWSAVGNRYRLFSQDLPQLSGSNQAVDLRFLIVPFSLVLPTVEVEPGDTEGGEFREDHQLSFLFHRSGSTQAALPVLFSTSGSATIGQDTALLPSSVVIPVGEQSAELQVTVLNDAFVEGTENLTVGITPSGNYLIGEKSSATLQILDRPLQDFLHSIQSSSPLADVDGDGQPDLLEYFMGSDALDPSDVGAILADRRQDGTFLVRFSRSKAAMDVTGIIEWSTDLTHWFRDGDVTRSGNPTITTQVVSPEGDDPEMLEAVLAFSPETPIKSIFARLAVNL